MESESGGAEAIICVNKPDGEEMHFTILEEPQVKVLQCRTAHALGMNYDRHAFDLASGDQKTEHLDTCIGELPSLCFSPALRRLTLVRGTGPELRGKCTYRAGGVVGHDGCMYFAPYCGERVLRITAEDVVEQVGD